MHHYLSQPFFFIPAYFQISQDKSLPLGAPLLRYPGISCSFDSLSAEGQHKPKPHSCDSRFALNEGTMSSKLMNQTTLSFFKPNIRLAVLLLLPGFCILRLSTLGIVKGQKIVPLCKQAFIPYHVGMHYLQNVFWGCCATKKGSKSIPFPGCGTIRAMATARPAPDLQTMALFRSDHFQPAPVEVRDFLYAKRLCLPFQQDAHFLVAALQPSLGCCGLASAHRQRCFRARWTLDG